jgi:hypothetical protein
MPASVVFFFEFVVVHEWVGLGTGNNIRDIWIHTVRATRAAVLAILRILAAGGLLLAFLLEGFLARALGLRGPGTIRHNGLVNFT